MFSLREMRENQPLVLMGAESSPGYHPVAMHNVYQFSFTEVMR